MHLENLMVLYQERHNDRHPELYFSKVDDFFLVIIDRTTLARRMRQQHELANIENPAGVFLRSIGFPFIRDLISEIEDQFVCSPILQGFGAFDPRNIPDGLEDLADFGQVIIMLKYNRSIIFNCM